METQSNETPTPNPGGVAFALRTLAGVALLIASLTVLVVAAQGQMGLL